MGSIAQVWDWFIHVPFLGWALAAFLLFAAFMIGSFIRYSIRNG